MAPAAIGIMGKHPGYGDFVRYGLSDPVADGLSKWLDTVLFNLRDDLGEAWQPLWDAAPDLRFWIGNRIFGRTLAGVLRPSRDRVGRRYPLLIVAERAALDPPTLARDQGVYDAFTAHLDTAKPGQGAAALLDGLSFEVEEEETGLDPLIWAHQPDGDLDALLSAAGPVDLQRASGRRCHLWDAGGEARAPAWLSQDGLPDAAALRLMLTGMPLEKAAEPESDVIAEESDGS